MSHIKIPAEKLVNGAQASDDLVCIALRVFMAACVVFLAGVAVGIGLAHTYYI